MLSSMSPTILLENGEIAIVLDNNRGRVVTGHVREE
jgi:hypothetical protein